MWSESVVIYRVRSWLWFVVRVMIVVVVVVRAHGCGRVRVRVRGRVRGHGRGRVRVRARVRVHGHVRARVRVRRSKEPRPRESEPEGCGTRFLYRQRAIIEDFSLQPNRRRQCRDRDRWRRRDIAVKGEFECEFECEGVGEGVGEGERREAGSAPDGIQDIDDTSSIMDSCTATAASMKRSLSLGVAEGGPEWLVGSYTESFEYQFRRR
ncbi:hypothetical protein BDN70DRAFT_886896 [Pholiota conissans]|uniref:Uncharacterized protein n=1 Tax=Pholiota conissans TaxID=109636 RepID=A0A9P6CTX7_9AGAR|nr:hypothetical protein BDN70DRAFT_886896 [Pholiota conissans]